MTIVDTNVLLDIVTNDPIWADWSAWHLSAAGLAGPLVINSVIYAECSVRFASMEAHDAFVALAGLRLDPIPRAALFQAGKAFQAYRISGGTRTGVLPDFFIGAHAAVAGCGVLTRDARHYRSYFPDVGLTTP